jgi:AsmA protein
MRRLAQSSRNFCSSFDGRLINWPVPSGPFFPAAAWRFAVKTTFKIAAIIVALIIVVGLVLPLLVNVNNFRPQIESTLTSTLGRAVKLGNMSFSVFSASVGADQLTIADDPKFGTAPFIQAKTLRVGVEIIPLLFSKHLNVTRIVIDHPQITLLRDRDGGWNFSSLGKQSGQTAQAAGNKSAVPPTVNIGKLEVSDGTVSLGSTTGKRNPIVYDRVNVQMKDFSFTRAFPLTVSARLPGGGSLKMDGTAGPIDSADTTLTPLRADVKLKQLDLAQSALVNPELGITGSADFDGMLTSDGRFAKATGTVKATSLKLVPKGSPAGVPVQLDFAIEHDLQKESGKIMRGDVAIGKALAKLTGTYDMHEEVTTIHAGLNGQAMPVDDLEGVLPAVGVILPTGSKLKGGMLALEIDSTGPLDKLVSTGWIRMTNTSLAGFNLGSQLSAISTFTGKQTGNDTKIENLSCDIRNAPEGMRLDKINVVIPSLATVTGAGTISPSSELDFKMVANLSGAGGDLTKVAGFGSGGIPVSVGGTTSNPTFTPDMKEMVTGKIKGLTRGKDNPLGSLGGLFGKKKP